MFGLFKLFAIYICTQIFGLNAGDFQCVYVIKAIEYSSRFRY